MVNKEMFHSEMMPLIEEYRVKLTECEEKFRDAPGRRGLDDAPGSKEWYELFREYNNKAKIIIEKYKEKL